MIVTIKRPKFDEEINLLNGFDGYTTSGTEFVDYDVDDKLYYELQDEYFEMFPNASISEFEEEYIAPMFE